VRKGENQSQMKAQNCGSKEGEKGNKRNERIKKNGTGRQGNVI
jgi:hypothetical protein